MTTERQLSTFVSECDLFKEDQLQTHETLSGVTLNRVTLSGGRLTNLASLEPTAQKERMDSHTLSLTCVFISWHLHTYIQKKDKWMEGVI